MAFLERGDRAKLLEWTKIAEKDEIDVAERRRNRRCRVGVSGREMEAPMTLNQPDPINNPGSDPNASARRTGGSSNDPHGGHEGSPDNRPDPDPISELATIDSDSQDNDPDRPHLANQPGPKPGFGPNPHAEKLGGNPELGIDPREAAVRAGDGK